MAGYLKVTPEKLQQTAASFAAKASQVNNLASQMASIASSLTGTVWTGTAQTAYTGKLNSLQADVQRINKMVQEHSDDLIQMAATYQSAESSSESLASSLSTNVIV